MLNPEEIEEFIERFNNIKSKAQSNQKYAADVLNLCYDIDDDELLSEAQGHIVYGTDIQYRLIEECDKLHRMEDMSLGGIIIAIRGIEKGSDTYYWKDAYGNFSTLSPVNLDTLVECLTDILRDRL